MIKVIPLNDVKLGMCLAESVTDSANQVIYKKNFYFTSRDQIIQLLDHGVKTVKINLGLSIVEDRSKKEQQEIENKVKKELENPERRFKKMTNNIIETKEIYDHGEKVVEDVMTSVRFGKALDQKAVREETMRIFKDIQNDPMVSLALLDLKNFDEYTFIHSINVAVLSIALAHHIRFADERVTSVGQGSILHDVGKAKIPINILNKPDKLNDTEFRIMRKHPNFGVDVLVQENMDNDIVKEIILHHHEDFDGTGYPNRIGGTDMKRYASIVSIADFYDALTTQRVYKPALAPPEAIQMIFSLSGTKFDPRVVNHFIKVVGIYPVGSIVELSDHRIASVIAFSRESLLQPIVKTFFHKDTPKILNVEVISLVHSELYILGIYNDYIIKSTEIFSKA